MAKLVSARATAVISHRYDDFPVREEDLDLRGDNSPPLPTVTAALAHQTRAQDLAGYGDVQGDPRLREALGALFTIPAANVVITSGGSEALNLALLCTTDPGERILLPTPAFPGFDQLAHLANLDPVHYPVPGPPCDAGDIVTVICTPHNPTGICTQPSAIVRGQRPIIWDVCHMPPLPRQLRHLSATLGEGDIVVFSASKLLRIPGARIGMLASHNNDLIAAVVNVKTHSSMSTSLPSQQLTTTVLTLPSINADIASRTAMFDRHLNVLAAAIHRSATLTADDATAGTHLLVHTRTSQDAYDRLRELGIIGVPGPVFGAPASTVRLCVAQPEPVILSTARILAAQ